VIGLGESRLASETGLGAESPTLLSLIDPDCIVPEVGVATRTTYLALDLAALPRLPQVQTLCATITQVAPAAGAVQLWVEGLDENGEPQQEITPLLPTAAKTTTHVHLARIYSWVKMLAYRGTFSGGSTLQVGVVNDLARANTATVEHVAAQNLGWWTWREISPRAKDPMLNLRLDNLTTGELWIARTGAVQVSYSEPGFFGSRDKWGLDFALLRQPSSGALPTYTPGDIVQMLPNLLADDAD